MGLSSSARVLDEHTVIVRLPVNDLNFGSFLYARGYRMASFSVEWQDVEVVFENVPGTEILDFMHDRVSVAPKLMLEAFRTFRTLTRTLRRSTGGVKLPPPVTPPISVLPAPIEDV